MLIQLENSFRDLGQAFTRVATPSLEARPELLIFNHDLAHELGLPSTSFDDRTLAEIFSGKSQNTPTPLSTMAYAGHQFGHFVPQLGDGRAMLLGEITSPNEKRFDLQLKGSGPTEFSRGGDGFSALGPVIREYLVSESMHALGVPTTRALAAVNSGQTVSREKPLAGGVFTRVASSHIRVGTFEYFFHREMIDEIKTLTEYTIARHYPELTQKKDKYLLFFRAVAHRLLKLAAHWMSLGFIHGVMNTDNTAISGETLDFGPCAFMDEFSNNKVFSSIDRRGRYAYGNQGQIMLWNLSVFANCLLPLLNMGQNEAQSFFEKEFEELATFFDHTWLEFMAKKLGIFDPRPEDKVLITSFLTYLEKEQMDFTISFRNLPKNLNSNSESYQKISQRLNSQNESLEQATNLMNSVNPYIIPRNHLVEEAIQQGYRGDYSFFKEMVGATKNPYKENAKLKNFALPPKPHQVVEQTFCGT